LLEVVPAYVSIMLVYDVLQLTEDELIAELIPLCQRWLVQPTTLNTGRKLQLPCYYHPETGPDLANIAALSQLSCEEVIQLHQQQRYLVYCIGFAPGFAYLGFVDPRLETPRLKQPRARVPAGAVGIADQQTAVYPAASPGGWNLIGNCPVALFNPSQRPMMPFAVGDSIEFVAISKAEFISLGGDINAKIQAAR
jgi:KipI family sensor histidine kinase inhibitor